jgi:hypothetical protein
MTDGIGITQGGDNQGVSELVATDQCTINGVPYQVQLIKLGYGEDGSFTLVDADTGLPIFSEAIGSIADVAWVSGNGSVVALLKNIAGQFSAGLNVDGAVELNDSEGVKGQVGGITINISSSFNRPNNSTAYAANAMIANSVTGSSVTYPTLACARVANGSFQIDRMRLTTTSANVAGLTVRVRLWSSAAPSYSSSGDGSAYAANPNTTASVYLGSFIGVWEGFSGKSTAILGPEFYGPLRAQLFDSLSTIWWDVQTLDGFNPTASAQFILTAEVQQD